MHARESMIESVFSFAVVRHKHIKAHLHICCCKRKKYRKSNTIEEKNQGLTQGMCGGGGSGQGAGGCRLVRAVPAVRVVITFSPDIDALAIAAARSTRRVRRGGKSLTPNGERHSRSPREPTESPTLLRPVSPTTPTQQAARAWFDQ